MSSQAEVGLSDKQNEAKEEEKTPTKVVNPASAVQEETVQEEVEENEDDEESSSVPSQRAVKQDQRQTIEATMKSAYRQELVDRFLRYQRDRRELRRRNAQSQAAIAHFFRRHRLNLFPGDPDKSQTSLREEYNRLLKRIEMLAGQKEQESQNFDSNMEHIQRKDQSLQGEITKILNEMTRMKLAAARASVHTTTGKTMTQKEVSDHIKILDSLELELQPVRLQNARLRKQMEVVEEKWRDLKEKQNKHVDATEVLLETQIFVEKCDLRKEESTQLLKALEEDSIVTAHTKTKFRQQQNQNFQLRLQLNEQLNKMDELKIAMNGVKSEIAQNTKEIHTLEKKLGLCTDLNLLSNYVETMKQMESKKWL